jgi:hypothetical protein
MTYIIPQEPCASSSIKSRGYDLTREVLAITFTNGDVWHYGSIPDHLAEEFFQAESTGRFYAQRIKGKFPAEKMTGPCPKCGDTGLVGLRCTDCGCADYEKEPRPFIENERGEREPIGVTR